MLCITLETLISDFLWVSSPGNPRKEMGGWEEREGLKSQNLSYVCFCWGSQRPLAATTTGLPDVFLKKISDEQSLQPGPSLSPSRRCWDTRPPPASLSSRSSSHPESRAHTEPLARPLRDIQPKEDWEGWRHGGRCERKRSKGINV